MIDFFTLLSGAIIGFLVSIAKDYISENRKIKVKDKEFKRNKIEETFILLEKTYENTFHFQDNTYNLEVDINKLRMLTAFYFPDLSDAYQKFYTVYYSFVLKNNSTQKNFQARDLEFEFLVFRNKIIEESKKYV